MSDRNPDPDPDAPLNDADRVARLRDRFVGQRYRDTRNDEGLTVINVTPPFIEFMYDDGTLWDTQLTADALSDDMSERLGVEENGIEGDDYEQLPPGPGVFDVCDQGEHKLTPAVEDVWPDPPATEHRPRLRDTYTKFARCARCGLSPFALDAFNQLPPSPWWCRICDALTPAEDLEYETADYYDEPVCPDCIDEAGGISDDAYRHRHSDTDDEDGDDA